MGGPKRNQTKQTLTKLYELTSTKQQQQRQQLETVTSTFIHRSHCLNQLIILIKIIIFK